MTRMKATLTLNSGQLAESRIATPATPPDTPLQQPTVSISTQRLFPSPSTSTASTIRPLPPSRSTSIRENVQVLVRVRPLSAKEQAAGQTSCWSINPEQGMIRLVTDSAPGLRQYYYDRVVSGDDNDLVYDAGVRDLVRSTMNGYNGTVFAYGQTASGKTYTMMGTPQEPGVIPKAVRDVFLAIDEHPTREFMLRVSYLEIYNEKIRDLLSTDDDAVTPQIRQDVKRGVHVTNIKEHKVTCVEEVMETIRQGEVNRHVSSTEYNTDSSRSHTIFQMTIESREKNSSRLKDSVRISQLNLIDLAGSEKATSDSDRRKEGAFINKSLLTLGNVISRITDPSSPFVPYRDSKLTRILETSLSGNARVFVICTINPTLRSKDESLNTLRFAQRAKMVKVAAKMTKIDEQSELQKCFNEIAALRSQMQEKTELQEETQQKLRYLVGLILTSSRHTDKSDQITDVMDDDFSGAILNDHQAMHKVFVQCEQNLTARMEENIKLREAIKTLEKHIVEQSAQIRQHFAAVAEQTSISKQYLVQIQRLDAEVARLEALVASEQSARRAAEDSLESVQCALENEKTRIHQLEQCIADMEKADMDQTIEEHDKQIAALEKQVAEWQDKCMASWIILEQKDAQQSAFEKQIEDLQDASAVGRSWLQEKEAQIAELQKQVAQWKMACEVETKADAFKDLQIAAFEKQVAQWQYRCETSSREQQQWRTELQDEVVRWKQAFEMSDKVIVQKEAQIIELQKQVAKLQEASAHFPSCPTHAATQTDHGTDADSGTDVAAGNLNPLKGAEYRYHLNLPFLSNHDNFDRLPNPELCSEETEYKLTLNTPFFPGGLHGALWLALISTLVFTITSKMGVPR